MLQGKPAVVRMLLRETGRQADRQRDGETTYKETKRQRGQLKLVANWQPPSSVCVVTMLQCYRGRGEYINALTGLRWGWRGGPEERSNGPWTMAALVGDSGRRWIGADERVFPPAKLGRKLTPVRLG
ncbi:hypothetical protein IF1G_01080 [Cordyceps javanica]|uniref:Uncharacterized protein n=1 Tax=Cordyceps javanica TaxID=43265 RepID=A0A545VHE7_9HYPO|nr:hypothetical protein IF1G_01080 [Cordyceps javanica]